MWALVLALGGALAACATAPPAPSVREADPSTPTGVDPVSFALLAANGQTPGGPTTSTAITVDHLDQPPWSQYLDVSKRAGLDFTNVQGRSGELRRTPIEGRHPDAAAYVLVIDGAALGAWIGPGGNTSGVVSIAERP